MKNPDGRKWVIKGVGKLVNSELKKLCSDDTKSIQMSKDPAMLSIFPWTQIIDEGIYVVIFTKQI